MKKALICLCLVLPCCLGGCFDQRIFENTAVIIYAGAEKGEEDTTLFSFAAANSEDDDNALIVVAAENELMETAISDLTAKTENPLKAGKIQVILFGDTLANEGLSRVSDANRLESSNRFLADYCVVKGSPNQLLKGLSDMEIDGGVYCYLDKILQNGAEAGVCPNTLRREFNIDFETEGIDPILPLLSYDEEKGDVFIEGTALFDDDRRVGDLSVADSRYLSLLTASPHGMHLALRDIGAKNGPVSVTVARSKCKMKVRIENDVPVVLLRLKLRTFFDISDWAEISADDVRGAKAEIEQQIAHHCLDVCRQLQAAGCDPLGIGAKLKGYHPGYYARHQKDEAYAKTIFKIKVDNNLINHENP